MHESYMCIIKGRGGKILDEGGPFDTPDEAEREARRFIEKNRLQLSAGWEIVPVNTAGGEAGKDIASGTASAYAIAVHRETGSLTTAGIIRVPLVPGFFPVSEGSV